MHDGSCIVLVVHKKLCTLSAMSKAEKLLTKLLSGQSDKNFTFAEVALLLAHAGFACTVHGSHHIFRHADGRMLSIPVHGKTVKPAYIRQIRELLSP